MTTEKAIQQFLKGFFRAGGLTFLILVAGYWQYFWVPILLIGVTGGYMDMKGFETKSLESPTTKDEK
jgi:hypothetical protein